MGCSRNPNQNERDGGQIDEGDPSRSIPAESKVPSELATAGIRHFPAVNTLKLSSIQRHDSGRRLIPDLGHYLSKKCEQILPTLSSVPLEGKRMAYWTDWRATLGII